MRNLKKVLSLALALVMLLGMMVVGASAAADFKDADSIKNTEAVDVVSGIEVLKGDEKGNFNPTGTLTRAEAAVVIAKLDLGEAFGNLAPTNAATFSDVPVNHWAKAYIDYCAARGLIVGSAGKFMPNDSVTGVAFGLMVSRVLGYEDANESLGGTDWEVKAAALARKAGLTKDVVLSTGTVGMTRDEMAQVTFNALTADMVEYDGRAITIGNVVIPAGKATAVENKGTGAVDYDSSTDGKLQLCEQKFPQLKVTEGNDDFQRPSTKWTYARTKICEVAKTAESEWTGKIAKASVISSALNVQSTTNANIYVDGVKQAATKLSGFDVSLTGNGVLTQAWYDDSSKTATVTVINTYLVKATSAYNATSKTLSVNGYGVTLSGSKISNDDVAVSEFKKDDLILVTGSKDNDDNKLVIVTAQAAPVERDVKISVYKGTDTNKDYVTFGGTKYNYSKNAAYDPDTVYAAGGAGYNLQSTSYNMVMDTYGHVIGVEKFSDEVTLDDILFVKDAAKSGFEYLAKVVFMDGTEETIKIAGTKKVSGAEYKKPTAATSTDHTALGADGGISHNRFYQFEKKSNGEYNLLDLADATRQDKAEKTTDDAKKNLVAGEIQPIYSGTTPTKVDKTATNSTIVIADGKVYTGVKNVPSVSNNDVYYLLDSSTNDYILAAVTDGKGVTTVDVSEYVYVFTGNGKGMKDEKGNTYYPYSVAIKNGEKVTDFEAATANKTNGLYQIETYENDYPVLGTAIAGDKAGVYKYAGTVTEDQISYREGTVTVTGIGAFGLAEEAKVYLVDKTAKSVDVIDPATVGNLDDGTYEVCAIQESATNKNVAVIWIIKKAAATTAVGQSDVQTKVALSSTKTVTVGGNDVTIASTGAVSDVVTELAKLSVYADWDIAAATNDITFTAKQAGEVKANATGGVPTAALTGLGAATVVGKDEVQAEAATGSIQLTDTLTSVTIGGTTFTKDTANTSKADDGTFEATFNETTNVVSIVAKTTGTTGNGSKTIGGQTVTMAGGVDHAAAVKAKYTATGVTALIAAAETKQAGSLTIGGHTAPITKTELAGQLAEFVAHYNANASGRTTWEVSVSSDNRILFTAKTPGAVGGQGPASYPAGVSEKTAGADPT